jgi:hypothetical protein
MFCSSNSYLGNYAPMALVQCSGAIAPLKHVKWSVGLRPVFSFRLMQREHGHTFMSTSAILK